ncbi:MAG TPA: TetR/AcrR family transcriptional regulator [Chloroflexota bacterium]|nr:TetR/AcrR family transcriptional regulator [Chloroflexota bacterium]
MSLPVTARGMEMRARLLAAAEKVFGERGYYRVGIVDITREAGTGTGTFYVYFVSKEAAFRELVQHLGHELRKATHLASDQGANRVEAERASFRAFFDFIAQHQHMYRLVRQAEFIDPALFHEYYEVFAAGYRSALSAAMDRGEIARMDPEVLAYCLMGIGDFVGMRWVLWTGEPMPPAILDSLMTFIRRGIAAHGEHEGGVSGNGQSQS